MTANFDPNVRKEQLEFFTAENLKRQSSGKARPMGKFSRLWNAMLCIVFGVLAAGAIVYGLIVLFGNLFGG